MPKNVYVGHRIASSMKLKNLGGASEGPDILLLPFLNLWIVTYLNAMKFLSLVGNSFGCSASGERLVSAARDGDLQEAKALLEYNPRLARYSTFGVRNSPLHYSAAQGHHEIVSLLLESGVDINLRNYRGQTALMQACQYGHWEVVQTLVLFKANIHRADYLNGGTALHLAALNGHSRCIRLLLADYIPSIPNIWNILRKSSKNEGSISGFNKGALHQMINRPSDGGITALHMAALNGHVETVQLLLDLGASVSEITVEDGTTIDLIGAGSTPLHYAACGGNAQCCQILLARGASLSAENANGWKPLMVAQSWHRDWLEEILGSMPKDKPQLLPSPYLCLPLMSIVKIARECGWRNRDNDPVDPCVVCLERKCTVAAEGCDHEFCIQCALYLCSTNSTSTRAPGPAGSIACPLCRHGIVSFAKLASTTPLAKEMSRTSLPLTLCSCSADERESNSLETPFCKPDFHCTRISPLGSFRSLSFQRFPVVKLNPSLCMGAPEVTPSLVHRTSIDRDRELRSPVARCSGLNFRRSTSHAEGRRSWLCSLNNV
ncbi:probable E3 ubiquitin-protein ligase XBOS32 [Diospyros lotus]|uniref:probable E3 ubiquitin-protein ligase XBOS32 n=1 Tax=Diospyros lotus TaxID=55363 RepID=UPI002255082E|nr:probable E3 ubiquitin-protein ligase XBOS32 [Diospyros lotus]